MDIEDEVAALKPLHVVIMCHTNAGERQPTRWPDTFADRESEREIDQVAAHALTAACGRPIAARSGACDNLNATTPTPQTFGG